MENYTSQLAITALLQTPRTSQRPLEKSYASTKTAPSPQTTPMSAKQANFLKFGQTEYETPSASNSIESAADSILAMLAQTPGKKLTLSKKEKTMDGPPAK